MSQADSLNAVEYEAETNWAENTSTFATHRLPFKGPIVLTGAVQDALDPNRHVQQLQGGTTPIIGAKDCSFTGEMWLHGHGADTSGAVTIDPIETYWGHLFGNPSLGEANSGPTRSAATGTTANSGSTTTNVVTIASGTFAKGSLALLGTGGLSADGRGGGQPFPVASHVTTNLALRAATPVALNSSDVVRPMVCLYLPETIANTAIKGLRKRFLTGNQKYEAHGCYPKAIRFMQLNPAEVPSMAFDWGASRWDSASAGTFPSAVSSNQYTAAPNAGGSVAIGDFGSTVRTVYDVRQFSLTVDLGVVPLPGQNTVDPFQRYVGARRVGSKIRWSFTVDAEVAGTHIWEDKYLAKTPIWIINSLSTTPGSAVCLYMQNCKIDKRPVQTSVNGINSVMVQGYACAGTDLSTDLSQAALVLGLG